jgi:hypothetical protein
MFNIFHSFPDSVIDLEEENLGDHAEDGIHRSRNRPSPQSLNGWRRRKTRRRKRRRRRNNCPHGC